MNLVAEAPLPSGRAAFDIGTGTGVLAALLARRGVRHVVATDLDPRAVACAGEKADRLGPQGPLRADCSEGTTTLWRLTHG
ncbi:methyltransferase domain-containing protein [Nonomuraea sp. NPDC049725]|uniref:methyltransferase domain-containing protein n=1 Tax=Nonomuraea sp. NPDC049725 TaxID=3154508 RepID=UPI00342A5B3B